MDAWEAEVALLDAVLEPIARRPIDVTDPGWVSKMRAGPSPVVEAGVETEAAAALNPLIDR